MKKNILFIVPTLCGGGAEKTVANLSLKLEKKYNVRIALFKDTPVKYSFGGEVIFLGKGNNVGLLKKIIFFMKAVMELRMIKKMYKIDYSISFLTPADFMNVLSKRRGCSTIVSIRNTDSILMSSRIMKLMTKYSCRHADRIVSISKQVKDDLINNFGIAPKKIRTIYNPSMLVRFGDKKEKIDSRIFGSFTFINTGRLVDQKGQWHLIRSFSRLAAKYDKVKLIILGQGPNREYLEQLINAYGLADNVSLLGFVSNPYDYMINSDCFVFSSLYEGLGNALLEAIACGLPIISTDCVSGPREILDPKSDYKIKTKKKFDCGEYGILCPVFDGRKRGATEELTDEEYAFADAMEYIVKNPKKKLFYKSQSLKRSKDFSIDCIANSWEKILC